MTSTKPRNSTIFSKSRYSHNVIHQDQDKSIFQCIDNSRSYTKPIKLNIYSFTSFQEVDCDYEINQGNLDHYCSYSVVKNKYTSKLYIKKTLDLRNTPMSKIEDIREDIRLYEKLHHKNILKVYSQKNSQNKYIIEVIQDYSSKGTLNDFIIEKKVLNEVNAFYIFEQILNGINYLHSNNYVLHGELTPDKIRLTEHGRVIIESQLYSHHNKKAHSKYSFYAPKDDFFCLGAILSRMTKGSEEDIPISQECNELIQFLIYNMSIDNIQEIYEMSWIKKHQDNHKVIISQFRNFTSEKTNAIRSRSRLTTEVTAADENDEYNMNDDYGQNDSNDDTLINDNSLYDDIYIYTEDNQIFKNEYRGYEKEFINSSSQCKPNIPKIKPYSLSNLCIENIDETMQNKINNAPSMRTNANSLFKNSTPRLSNTLNGHMSNKYIA